MCLLLFISALKRNSRQSVKEVVAKKLSNSASELSITLDLGPVSLLTVSIVSATPQTQALKSLLI